MSFKLKDTDRGWKKYKARATEMKRGAGVTVGIHAQEGAEPHGRPSKTNEPPQSILLIGYWNEFGLGVPERSFIRAWFDAAKGENYELAKRMLEAILHNKISMETALEQMGAKFAGEVQKRIAEGIPPPNAPSTIAEKGSSTPLIDKGQLRQSVTYARAKR